MTGFRLLAALLALSASGYPFDDKKTKEETTQTLDVPKDPPASVTAETSRLVFHVSPLSAKGLLSQQIRDALKAELKAASGATIVKLRAFVAGSGDLRRVQTIVSEMFADKHLPLPALSVVQVGGLPLVGAQVVIESMAVAKKPASPLGLVFLSGQAASNNEPLEKVEPLAQKSLSNLRTALQGAGSQPADVLRMTCFSSSLGDHTAVRAAVETDFRRAALNFVQLQRGAAHSVVECEAVAKLQRKIAGPVEFQNPQGLNQSPDYSQLALVAAQRVVLTGTQLAYGYEDADARLAFQRLAKTLEQGGSSMRDVVMANIYPLSNSLAGQVRGIRFDFFDHSRPPASTLLAFEGLPAMKAGFALDVVAIAK